MVRWIGTLAIVGLVAGGVFAGAMILLPSVMPVAATLGAVSDVPSQINHQGVLTVGGERFTGSAQFYFAIVDPDTGNHVWTNDGSGVGSVDPPGSGVSIPVNSGVYSVRLGAGPMVPLSADLFANGNLRLRAWVDTGEGPEQLAPDHVLTSVPYAFAIADGAVTAAKLAGDAVTTDAIEDGAVTPAKLAAGVVTPAGVVQSYAGSVAPTGWLLCDGQTVSKSTYPGLFDVIGYTYGGSEDNFNLPNLKGRVPVGLDAGQGEFDALGETGGAKTHVLAVSEMPSHTHSSGTLGTSEAGAHEHSVSGTAASAGSHSHTTYAFQFDNTTATGGQNRLGTLTGSGSQNNTGGTSSDGAHTHSISGTAASAGAHSHSVTGSAGSTGSGGAHNNLQPYIVLNHIIKY